MRMAALVLALLVSACAQEAPRKTAMPALSRAPAGEAFTGTVTEVLPAGGYTYLRVGDAWVVSLKKQLAVGDVVRVKPFGVAEQFESKKLQRSFERLQFSVVTKEKQS